MTSAFRLQWTSNKNPEGRKRRGLALAQLVACLAGNRSHDLARSGKRHALDSLLELAQVLQPETNLSLIFTG